MVFNDKSIKGKNNVSDLKIYSIGIVSKDKKTDTDIIDVYPREILSTDGANLNQINPLDSSSKDPVNDKQNKDRIDKSVLIQAKWLSLGNTNRITSPDVRVGGMVLLFRLGNTDQFYWVDLLINKAYRHLEKVVYAISNEKEQKEFTPDTSYFFKVDTHDKISHYHTSKNDKEYTTYDIRIEGKTGNLIVKDGRDNIIRIDSKKDRIYIYSNKTLHMSSKDVTIDCENFTVNSDTYTVNNTRAMAVNTKTLTTKVKTDYSIQTGTMTTNVASTCKLTASNLNITAKTTINGLTTIMPDAIIGGVSYMSHRHAVRGHSVAVAPPV